MEEALGKLDISEEEATPLVIDDFEEGSQPKWLLAGRVLCRNLLHIQTIQSALCPAWGNPRGLLSRSLGENTFAAEFESKRERDRVWDGSSWHINKHVVILENLEEHMQPSELVFETLPVWVRVVNLPYNLRNNKWGLAIARQIDKTTTVVQIDPVGGFLRGRVSIDVRKPLQRWILIESAKRKSTDKYEIEYEHIPHFCFSCGRLGYADPFCPSPGNMDENGDLLFKPSLWAAEDRTRTSSGEHQPKPSNQNNTRESRASSTKQKEGVEVSSPVKVPAQQKHKGVPQPTHTYKPVVKPLLALTEHEDAMHESWLCIGDFNETMNASEHFSQAQRSDRQMRAFHEVLDECGLQDLGWSGTAYTWDNAQAVKHIRAVESDHCFVMVKIKETANQITGRARIFRYEDV
ncbi:hypothetical protein D1007_24002 [Hordeum vulgare]|nr:hypothetical protein D1007_24002 [Hordeum vulgare]